LSHCDTRRTPADGQRSERREWGRGDARGDGVGGGGRGLRRGQGRRRGPPRPLRVALGGAADGHVDPAEGGEGRQEDQDGEGDGVRAAEGAHVVGRPRGVAGGPQAGAPGLDAPENAHPERRRPCAADQQRAANCVHLGVVPHWSHHGAILVHCKKTYKSSIFYLKNKLSNTVFFFIFYPFFYFS